MKYEQLQTGDVLLYSGKSPLARAIKFFQKCEWNHSGNIFVRKDGVVYVIEATEHGIVPTNFNDYHNRVAAGKGKVLIGRPKVQFNEDKYVSGLAYHLGLRGCVAMMIDGEYPTKPHNTPYEFENLILQQSVGFVTRWRLWLGKQIDRADNRFICGEFSQWAYNKALPYAFPDWNRGNPKGIFNCKWLFDFSEYEV